VKRMPNSPGFAPRIRRSSCSGPMWTEMVRGPFGTGVTMSRRRPSARVCVQGCRSWRRTRAHRR
jgi:hypothetical protein